MKFTSVLILVTALIVAIMSASAMPYRETNGERFARGLPPLPPQRRSGTPAYGTSLFRIVCVFFLTRMFIAAKRTSPSGSPGGTCSTGPVQCCTTVANKSNPAVALILGLLGIVIGDATELLGLGCTAVVGNTW